MRYIKLICLQIDDLESSIFSEQNYGIADIDKARIYKQQFEKQGYFCVLIETKMELNL